MITRHRSSLVIIGLLLLFGLYYRLATGSTSLPIPIPTSRVSSDKKFSSPRTLEIEGTSLGRPFTDVTLTANVTNNAILLTGSLMTRLSKAVSALQNPVDCPLHVDRYRDLIDKTTRFRYLNTISIAINLYNSEAVLPTQAQALILAVALLKQHYRVFVSVYENDSKDHTRVMLGHLAAALTVLDLDGLWVVSSNLASRWDVLDRITLLGEIRNTALRPLLPFAGGHADTLVFINDVFFCVSDILELILQRQLQGADVVAGNDWDQLAGQLKVYDLWVHRGINGDLVYPHNATQWLLGPNETYYLAQWAYSTQSRDVYQRWLDSRPFPVYSVWDGMVALDASLFTREHLRFRSNAKTGWTGGGLPIGAWGELVSEDSYMAGDCPGASECELLMRDVWNLRLTRAKIVIAPLVNTAYSAVDWTMRSAILPLVNRWRELPDEAELVQWGDVQMPKEVVCIPSRTASGEAIEKSAIWGASWLLLDPAYRPYVDEEEAENL